MMKKLLTLFTLLLPLAMLAQTGVGDWRIHPTYVPTKFENCIDTGDKIYYLVSGSLFCLDKATQENLNLNKRNYLSDVTITKIFYNYDKQYLVVAYLNSNIDIIKADGKVVNMPEISDAVMTTTKAINDITFADGKMFVATDFGYVVLDDTKLEVRESRIFNTKIQSMAQVGDWIVMNYGSKLYYASATAFTERISSYVAAKDASGNSIALANATFLPVNSTRALVGAKNLFGVLDFTLDASGKPVFTLTTIAAATPNNILKTPDGFIANCAASGFYYTLDANGGNATQVTGGNEIYTKHDELWALGANGLHRAGDTNYYNPDGIGITTTAFWLNFDPKSNLMYLSSTANNAILPTINDVGAKTEIFAYDGTRWTDVTPANVPASSTATSNGNRWLCIDPINENSYFFSTRSNGMVQVLNGEIKAVHNSSNSPITKYMGADRFDSQGNLWCVRSASSDVNQVFVLPKDKIMATPSKSNWIIPTVPNIMQKTFFRANFAISKGTDIKVFCAGDYQRPIVIWDDGGNISNLNPRSRTFLSFLDQDDKAVTWNFINSISSDNTGLIWVGLGSGIISFDPTQAFNENFRVNHIKVPRNDGTGLADYLLDGIYVTCVEPDGANRKWIGTNAGLFLVSADGSQVIKEFTTDNSYLPSNLIYNVCCNTSTNSVFIVTSEGVLEYFSDTTPAEPNFDNVIVYPNPVRPDFTGLLTISGLMDNSLLKITDSGGNVVKQLRSIGGMATWDCCNEGGDRVATGVYYVVASSSEDGSSNSIVAKFLVVK